LPKKGTCGSSVPCGGSGGAVGWDSSALETRPMFVQAGCDQPPRCARPSDRRDRRCRRACVRADRALRPRPRRRGRDRGRPAAADSLAGSGWRRIDLSFAGRGGDEVIAVGLAARDFALADQRVERSLYQRAVGYHYDAVKIFMPATRKPSCWNSGARENSQRRQRAGTRTRS